VKIRWGMTQKRNGRLREQFDTEKTRPISCWRVRRTRGGSFAQKHVQGRNRRGIKPWAGKVNNFCGRKNHERLQREEGKRSMDGCPPAILGGLGVTRFCRESHSLKQKEDNREEENFGEERKPRPVDHQVKSKVDLILGHSI